MGNMLKGVQMRYLILFLIAVFFLNGCGGGGGGSSSNNNQNNAIVEDVNSSFAVKFLNKATFGASTNDVKELQKLGVEHWLDKQLNMPLEKNVYLKKMIEIAKMAEPSVNTNSIDEYITDNNIVFNKSKASFQSPRFFMSSWFYNTLSKKDQLRHKVAYALSQIIVESDFEPIFTRRGEALARYFDILYQDAFSTYKQLLRDISFNSGMGMYLTFNGNKVLYKNKADIYVYPDENYAREVMQLFSIGLNKLKMDGTSIKDAKGNLIPTYTQTDVNELSRVFTGWDLKRNNKFGQVGFTRGDLTHPLEFTAKYHDDKAKKLLGETIEAGLSGKDDIYRAIDIIMAQESVAPYISKNLIMRLTKSNPSSEYISRVANVFKNSGSDLKKVTKAIFMDPELWNDLKNSKIVKFKEPLIAYTQFLRSMYAKPFNNWYFCGFGAPQDDTATNCQKVNSFLFNDTRSYLAQGPGRAPSVFNFYDNSFIPNDSYFQNNQINAPELQIQSDTMLINFNNQIRNNLLTWEKGYILEHYYKDEQGNWHRYTSIKNYTDLAPKLHNIPVYYVGADKMLLDAKEEYNILEMASDGDTNGDFKNIEDNAEKSSYNKKALKALIAFENNKLTGGMMSQEEMDVIYDALKDKMYNKYNNKQTSSHPQTKKYQLYTNTIVPVIRAIVTSDAYMTE